MNPLPRRRFRQDVVESRNGPLLIRDRRMHVQTKRRRRPRMTELLLKRFDVASVRKQRGGRGVLRAVERTPVTFALRQSSRNASVTCEGPEGEALLLSVNI